MFFDRYIRGLWKVAEGLIYSTFTEANLYDDTTRPLKLDREALRMISCDYGTTNPCVFLDTFDDGETIWIDNEYRWDSRSLDAQRTGQPQKTDAQYVDDMRVFMGNEFICGIIVDPSAASFILALRQAGFLVYPGDNEVKDGIRICSTFFQTRRIMIHRERCQGLINELQAYVWDNKAALTGDERPVKENDHAPDAMRYRINALPNWRKGVLNG